MENDNLNLIMVLKKVILITSFIKIAIARLAVLPFNAKDLNRHFYDLGIYPVI
jgi:hypothetical protein